MDDPSQLRLVDEHGEQPTDVVVRIDTLRGKQVGITSSSLPGSPPTSIA